jgi:tetratricopeptide (TPR) repeat protein
MSNQIFEAILLCALLGTVLYQLFWHRRIRSAMDVVLAAYRRGDYEIALQASERLRRAGKHTREYCFFRGTMLFQLGKLDEAERWLRESIVLSTRDRMSASSKAHREVAIKQAALASSALGQLHLEKSQYDDATCCFEASLKNWPGQGSAHRELAEAWLRRGQRSAEALKWARLAVEADRKAPLDSEEVNNINLSEDLATLAWAVATASPESDSARAEVDRLIGEAVPLIGGTMISVTATGAAGSRAVPPAALVHYQAGLAYAALGDQDQSAHYLAEAGRIDPTGRWGRAARSRQGS